MLLTIEQDQKLEILKILLTKISVINLKSIKYSNMYF